MTNLAKRTISGTAYVLIYTGCMLYGSSSFAILFTITIALALNEFNELMLTHCGASINNLITTISGVYLFLAVFCVCVGATSLIIFLPYLASLLFVLVSELYLKQENPLANYAYTFAGQIYIALPFALLNLLAFYGNEGYSGTLPYAVFLMLWINDSGAYCFGSLLHKKFPYKLFERISPHKSWVGSICGGMVALISAAIFSLFSDLLTLPQWLGLSLVVVVFGSWGDLVESLIKRQLGIKDSGHFLPGHGGVLDRFDSALLAIPASVIYIYCIPYIF